MTIFFYTALIIYGLLGVAALQFVVYILLHAVRSLQDVLAEYNRYERQHARKENLERLMSLDSYFTDLKVSLSR